MIITDVCVCHSELNSKLADTQEMIEEALDVALSRSCTTFDPAYYAKVQLAYKYLGKTQVWSTFFLF